MRSIVIIIGGFILAGFLGLGCLCKEELIRVKLADVPISGILTTNFTVPNSSHIFLLLGFSHDKTNIAGTFHITGVKGSRTFPISGNSPRANWLEPYGIDSRMIITNSISARTSGFCEPGTECKFTIVLTNAPKAPVVYMCYLMKKSVF
jgi:hypothetical protein